MTTLPCPTTHLNLSTQVQLSEPTYERAVLMSLLADAHASGDATFRVMRLGRMTVQMDPAALLDRLTLRTDWVCLRPDARTVIVRATQLFGIVEALGAPEKCTLLIQLWTPTAEQADAVLTSILAEFRPYQYSDISFSLNWRFLDGKGRVARAGTEERASDPLLDEAYPVLGSVEGFIEQYLEAPEAVLVLQGAPGTGKTRLIRAILAAISTRRGESAEVLYTGDAGVLESDEVFLEFITGPHAAFVIEDADHLLKPRSGGNPTLHRFLNIADGIASAHGKKIMFSTNLPNVRDIDEALVRPGRCYAHLYLEALQPCEAVALLKRLCRETPERHAAALALLNLESRKSLSVAEVYAAHRNAGAPRERSAGVRCGVARRPQRVAMGFN